MKKTEEGFTILHEGDENKTLSYRGYEFRWIGVGAAGYYEGNRFLARDGKRVKEILDALPIVENKDMDPELVRLKGELLVRDTYLRNLEARLCCTKSGSFIKVQERIDRAVDELMRRDARVSNIMEDLRKIVDTFGDDD